MLFNSYEFIFGFLPITVVLFFALGRIGRGLAIAWLIAASLFFYAYWRPVNVALIAPSIVINYVLARILQRHNEQRPALGRAVLWTGVAFNLAFLGYFKYRVFLGGVLNDVLGTNMVLSHLILPLGISFITFQKIAFLIDVQAGRVREFRFVDYALFVLFFPQLIAGPIVHYREMMPQFHRATGRADATDIAVGVSLFCFGMFKKVVLADAIAPMVTPLYGMAAHGAQLSVAAGWAAALGFMLQIYFDFSGYSDMALGLARLFGIKLPVNFNSPLRATSVIEFWMRWHVSLTRFLTAYLYNPIVMDLTRARAAAGKPGVAGRKTTPGAFATLLAGPTILVMFISGLWHGAGYQYLVWGLMHGAMLAINHAWRLARPAIWKDTASYNRVSVPLGFALTFVAVVVAEVMFRAPTVGTAFSIWRAMFGAGGLAATPDLRLLLQWIVALLAIALLLPNTLRIMAAFEPALGVKPRPGAGWAERRATWSPSLPWAAYVAVLGVAGILSLGRLSEFLYWQF